MKPLPGGELCKRGVSSAWAGQQQVLHFLKFDASRSGRAETPVVFISNTYLTTVRSNLVLTSSFVHQASDLIDSQKDKEYDERAHVRWAIANGPRLGTAGNLTIKRHWPAAARGG